MLISTGFEMFLITFHSGTVIFLEINDNINPILLRFSLFHSCFKVITLLTQSLHPISDCGYSLALCFSWSTIKTDWQLFVYKISFYHIFWSFFFLLFTVHSLYFFMCKLLVVFQFFISSLVFLLLDIIQYFVPFLGYTSELLNWNLFFQI